MLRAFEKNLFFFDDGKRSPVFRTRIPTELLPIALQEIRSKTNNKLFLTKNSAVHHSVIDNSKKPIKVEIEDFDDRKSLFKEAKYSAKRYLPELNNLLILYSKGKGISLKKHCRRKPINPNLLQSETPCTLPAYLVELLSFKYKDLIAGANKERLLANDTQLHKQDSGVFSKPHSPMSLLSPIFMDKEKNIEELRKHVGENKQKRSTSVVSTILQMKGSRDSGMLNDSPTSQRRRSSKAKALTSLDKSLLASRFEQFSQHGEKLNLPGSIPKILGFRKEQDRILEEVPVPPMNQQMISFAVSSKTCHEQGWVIIPSCLDDVEQHTLLVWAQAKLEQAIKQRKKQEALPDYHEKGKPVLVLNYGDNSCTEVTLKRKMKRKKIFTIQCMDASSFIFYPNGNPALVSSVTEQGKCTLVYGNDQDNRRLLAYFTSNGNGACFHDNGKIEFINTEKFGLCFNENGSLLKKWKWTKSRLQPPLSFQLNRHIVLRCFGKFNMTLSISISTVKTKINVGGKFQSTQMELGKLMTQHKFTSDVGIQLSKSLSNKGASGARKPFKSSYKMHYSKKTKKCKVVNDDVEFLPKEIEETTESLQADLRFLKQQFKATINHWLDYYRLATGLKSTKPSLQSEESVINLPDDILPRMFRGQRRLPSAPAVPMDEDESELMCAQRPNSSLGFYEGVRYKRVKDEYRAATPTGTVLSKRPFKCGLPRRCCKQGIIPKDGCPIALRMGILGEKDAYCRCDKRIVPRLSNLEFDAFLASLPRTQLVVVSLVDESNHANEAVDRMYCEVNRTRTFPCVQSRDDACRLFRYSISSDGDLLVKRHNVFPGMFMMYQGARLLFANYIFDGYDQTEQHFQRQITRARKDALRGAFLPDDFRFNVAHLPIPHNDIVLNDATSTSSDVTRISIPSPFSIKSFDTEESGESVHSTTPGSNVLKNIGALFSQVAIDDKPRSKKRPTRNF